MNAKRIISQIIALIFSISFISFGLARPPVHAPVITHEHEHEGDHEHAEAKEVASAASHTAKTNSVKSASDHARIAAVAAEKAIVPSSGAAKASIKKLFSEYGNGTSLNGYQIANASGNPALKGQHAAVVAALIVQINNTTLASPKDVVFTQTELLKKFSDKKSGFYISYTNAINKINQVKALPPSQQLFGPHKLTANTKIIQGSAGDCFFLSAINGILKTPGGPEKLKKMITKIPGEPNQFTVNLPGDSKPLIVKLNDAEIGMYSHIEKGGKWLAVLSVAEAMNLHKLHLDPLRTIGGGMPQQTLGMFTGKKYVADRLPDGVPDPLQAKGIVDKINNAKKTGMPIAIDTNDHVLAILGCENCVVKKNAAGAVVSVTGNVLIKNPWGSHGVWYNPKLGTWSRSQKAIADPKYLMNDNGEFTVPISQISNGFLDIVYHPDEAKNLNPSSV